MTKINVPLDRKSINRAIKEIEAYQKKLKELKPKFLKNCAKAVIEMANSNISNYDYDNNIIDIIKLSWRIVENGGNRVTLYNDSDKATYIEFGVGSIGKGTAISGGENVASNAGYNYDLNNHGTKGWGFMYDEYAGALDLRQPYYKEIYVDRPTGAYFIIHTRGEPATLFLFNAAMDFIESKRYGQVWEELIKEVK